MSSVTHPSEAARIERSERLRSMTDEEVAKACRDRLGLAVEAMDELVRRGYSLLMDGAKIKSPSALIEISKTTTVKL